MPLTQEQAQVKGAGESLSTHNIPSPASSHPSHASGQADVESAGRGAVTPSVYPSRKIKAAVAKYALLIEVEKLREMEALERNKSSSYKIYVAVDCVGAALRIFSANRPRNLLSWRCRCVIFAKLVCL